MNKIFTLIGSLLICTAMMGAKPEAVFTKLGDTAPVLDGEIDAVWGDATQYLVDKPFGTETPTVGTSYFKACWADTGIFVLVYVQDDVHVPVTDMPSDKSDSWTYDKPEIYFDVNDGNLEDGKGPGAGGGASAGHYQFAPNIDAMADGSLVEANAAGTPYKYAIKVTNPTYVIEYFIPFSSLLDENGFGMAQVAEFGFDVTIGDRDAAGDAGARNRMVWANVGAINESWNNMNDCGLATLDGATDLVYVDKITASVSANVIDVNNGTVQLSAVIEPADASNKNLIWTATPKNIVKISSTGLVTAVRDGEVTIFASSTDGGYIDSDNLTITVSNQILTRDEDNYVKNGHFNMGATGYDGWFGGAFSTVSDGVVVLDADRMANVWDQQFGQGGLKCLKDSTYILKVKLWADAPRTVNVNFEDPNNGYARHGTAISPAGVDGRSEWVQPITVEPTWYTYEVMFDGILENTDQNLKFLISNFDTTLYIDSVYLNPKYQVYGVEDQGTPVQMVNDNSINVYPNPVGNASQISVVLEKAASRVAVYNMVGQKMMEKTASGNVVFFDVTGLQKGIYFITLSDGTSQKFVR